MKKNKLLLPILAAVLALVVIAGVILVPRLPKDEVAVFPVSMVGYTDFYSGSSESYGMVTTDKVQTLYLSGTQTVTEILVYPGQNVKKGDVLFTYDTTLSERPQMFDSVARPYVLAFGDVFSTLPSCGVGGPMAQAAEAEKILACDPDIVISEFEDAEKSDALQEQLGVPVITLSAGSKAVFDEKFFLSMGLLGTVFDKLERADQLIGYIEEQRQAIEEKVAQIPEEEKPSVYICGLGNWGTTDHLMTAENYISFEVAGVKNVVSGLGMEGVGPIEEEKFVSLGEQMDMIIMDAAAVKNIKPKYAEDKTMFDTCKAWQEGEVYLEMAYNAYYTNYEIALMNTWFIAKTVYPELFADVDMTEKTNEVTKIFLGAELAEEIFACPGSFGGYGKLDKAAVFG